ncbi:hypothetical protein QE152_g19487 [Popillia japonica]|uniref:Uncharacterized protein n=1 Tax=Popillia japonica TaxID=7064 RepID=A0AAW1KNZ9_POPJA
MLKLVPILNAQLCCLTEKIEKLSTVENLQIIFGPGYFSSASETSKVVTDSSLCTCTHFRLHLHLVKSFLLASRDPSLPQSNRLKQKNIETNLSLLWYYGTYVFKMTYSVGTTT